MPGAVIEDRSDLLAKVRSVKSHREVALIQRAIDITAFGFEAMMRAARPGRNEFEVQEAIDLKDYVLAHKLLRDMEGRKGMNGNELGQIYNMQAYVFFSQEDYDGAIRSYERPKFLEQETGFARSADDFVQHS